MARCASFLAFFQSLGIYLNRDFPRKFANNFRSLEEESEDLSSKMFPSGFFVVHDAAGSGHHDVTGRKKPGHGEGEGEGFSVSGDNDNLPELPGGKEVVGPLLDVPDADVEPGRDDAALVQSSGQVDDDLAAAVIVHDLKFSDVAVLHHDGEETDHHLGAGADQDLPLSPLLSVVHGF